MLRYVLFLVVMAGASALSGAAAREPASNFRGFDAKGAPWEIAWRMPCDVAREKLEAAGLVPFTVAHSGKPRILYMPVNDPPHAMVELTGDFVRYPNVLFCGQRVSEFCDYAYRRRIDGRIFIFETVDTGQDDCWVNRIFFAHRRRSSNPAAIKPDDLTPDYNHEIALPSSIATGEHPH